MDYKKEGPTCKCISRKSFGHTGYTGTIAWADPDKQIIFIFLSNRIQPDEENKKLIKMEVRGKIMEGVYEAIK
ncbi:MAG: serine hydrolase [Bacteroidia bacterium]|nr:serine hydrolase [Bacteroidia bacterium]